MFSPSRIKFFVIAVLLLTISGLASAQYERGVVDGFSIPALTCPAEHTLVATFEIWPGYDGTFSLNEALIFKNNPEISYSYTNTTDVYATLTGYTVVGHPELGCPGNPDESLCSRADQLNEHFNIIVDGGAPLFVADPGDHAVLPIPNFDLGTLAAGSHTILFQHAGNPEPINSSAPSVGYKVGLCVQDVPPPPPPPAGDEGCTPGFWRNRGVRGGFYDATMFSTNTPYNSVFGVGPDTELSEAVQARGNTSGEALIRHSAAAVLNASHPDIAYPYSVQEVINLTVQGWAYITSNPRDLNAANNIKDILENANELGCFDD